MEVLVPTQVNIELNTDSAWLGGDATVVNSASTLAIPASGNTFQVTVDGIASGSLVLPKRNLYLRMLILQMLCKQLLMELQEFQELKLNGQGQLIKLFLLVLVLKTCLLHPVDSAIETNLKLTSSNGGVENDYSFDLYDITGALQEEKFF